MVSYVLCDLEPLNFIEVMRRNVFEFWSFCDSSSGPVKQEWKQNQVHVQELCGISQLGRGVRK